MRNKPYDIFFTSSICTISNKRILYKLKHYQNKIPFITLYKIPIYRLCLVNTMEFDIDAHVTVI